MWLSPLQLCPICTQPGTGHTRFLKIHSDLQKKLESAFCFSTSGLRVACHCQWTLATAGVRRESQKKQARVPLMGPVTYGEGDGGSG